MGLLFLSHLTWVHHGKYLEDELLSQLDSHPVFGDEEVNEALDNEGGGTLSRLLSRHHHHRPLLHPPRLTLTVVGRLGLSYRQQVEVSPLLSKNYCRTNQSTPMTRLSC